MSAGCRELLADLCSSRKSTSSRPDKEYADTLFASFAESIAIAE
jgi:hypothetical protein